MKIAVCDDDRLLTGEIDGQLQKIREKTGISFETDIFFDGETLWEAIEKNGSYDIVYLDIEMKNMDGITVARKIRDRDPYAILIFVSSYDSYYEQLFEVEPLRFLHKPIDPEKFEEYFRVAYKKLTSLEDRLHFNSINACTRFPTAISSIWRAEEESFICLEKTEKNIVFIKK